MRTSALAKTSLADVNLHRFDPFEILQASVSCHGNIWLRGFRNVGEMYPHMWFTSLSSEFI